MDQLPKNRVAQFAEQLGLASRSDVDHVLAAVPDNQTEALVGALRTAGVVDEDAALALIAALEPLAATDHDTPSGPHAPAASSAEITEVSTSGGDGSRSGTLPASSPTSNRVSVSASITTADLDAIVENHTERFPRATEVGMRGGADGRADEIPMAVPLNDTVPVAPPPASQDAALSQRQHVGGVDIPVGTEIAGCEVLGRVAVGGMGTVFRVRHQMIGREMALKIMAPWLTSSADNISLFLREARAAAALRHRTIVEIFDVGEADNHYYILMELVDGRDLARELKHRGKPFSPADTLYICVEVCKALHVAHKRRVIHCDVKPANVILSGGEVKVTDFGLAQIEGLRTARPDQPANISIVGSPYTMAPEQGQATSPIDQRADIYGLGATMYLLLTGRYPFNARDLTTVLRDHAETPVEPPSTYVPDLTLALDALLLRLLTKDPSKRPGVAAQVAADLREIAAAYERSPLADLAEASPDPWSTSDGSSRRSSRRRSKISGRLRATSRKVDTPSGRYYHASQVVVDRPMSMPGESSQSTGGTGLDVSDVPPTASFKPLSPTTKLPPPHARHGDASDTMFTPADEANLDSALPPRAGQPGPQGSDSSEIGEGRATQGPAKRGMLAGAIAVVTKALKAGDVPTARQAIDAAWARFPNHAVITEKRIEVNRAEGVALLREALRAIADGDGSAGSALLEDAEALLGSKDPALIQARSALISSRKLLSARLAKVEEIAQAGRLSEAEEALVDTQRTNPNDLAVSDVATALKYKRAQVNQLLTKADRTAREGDPITSLARLDDALAIDATNARARASADRTRPTVSRIKARREEGQALASSGKLAEAADRWQSILDDLAPGLADLPPLIALARERAVEVDAELSKAREATAAADYEGAAQTLHALTSLGLDDDAIHALVDDVYAARRKVKARRRQLIVGLVGLAIVGAVVGLLYMQHTAAAQTRASVLRTVAALTTAASVGEADERVAAARASLNRAMGAAVPTLLLGEPSLAAVDQRLQMIERTLRAIRAEHDGDWESAAARYTSLKLDDHGARAQRWTARAPAAAQADVLDQAAATLRRWPDFGVVLDNPRALAALRDAAAAIREARDVLDQHAVQQPRPAAGVSDAAASLADDEIAQAQALVAALGRGEPELVGVAPTTAREVASAPEEIDRLDAFLVASQGILTASSSRTDPDPTLPGRLLDIDSAAAFRDLEAQAERAAAIAEQSAWPSRFESLLARLRPVHAFASFRAAALSVRDAYDAGWDVLTGERQTREAVPDARQVFAELEAPIGRLLGEQGDALISLLGDMPSLRNAVEATRDRLRPISRQLFGSTPGSSATALVPLLEAIEPVLVDLPPMSRLATPDGAGLSFVQRDRTTQRAFGAFLRDAYEQDLSLWPELLDPLGPLSEAARRLILNRRFPRPSVERPAEPVRAVNWYQAVAFVRDFAKRHPLPPTLNLRLPTVAEITQLADLTAPGISATPPWTEWVADPPPVPSGSAPLAMVANITASEGDQTTTAASSAVPRTEAPGDRGMRLAFTLPAVRIERPQ